MAGNFCRQFKKITEIPMKPIPIRQAFLALLAIVASFACLEAALPVTGSPVAAWNEQALDAIRATSTPPPKASRGLAILHASIHDAYNGIARDYRQYLVTEGRPIRNSSKDAALAVAAHDVLVTLFPSRTAQFDAEQAAQLAPIAIGPARTRGMAWGQTVAAAILAARANDGSSSVVTYTPGVGPGYWRPTPPAYAPALLPQWGDLVPFGPRPIASFVPMAPPALTTSRYAEEVAQVQELGSANSTVRSADQTQIARFWANGGGTATPPGHWNQIARIVIAQQGLDVGEEARLMALLNLAMADAAIVSWNTKYEYNLWRPVAAIREADTDGNPLTIADPTWTPLLVTPPFPEYTSGHSTFSGAAAAVLARVFGRDSIAFVAESDDVPGIVRSYPSFSAAAAESGMSRIYGGIHFMSANRFGLSSGVAVGDSIAKRLLRSRDDDESGD
jgi:membrane-associated phospholipid phosphatase